MFSLLLIALGQPKYRSVSELEKVAWMRLRSYIGRSTTDLYNGTKDLNPQVSEESWTYNLPASFYPGKMLVFMHISGGKVTEYQPVYSDSRLRGGSYLVGPSSGGDPMALVTVTNKTRPELYVPEFFRWVTGNDDFEATSRKAQFRYPEVFDKEGAYGGQVNFKNRDFGQVYFVSMPLGNNTTAWALALGESDNLMMTGAAAFDPANSKSPFSAKRKAFDWRPYKVLVFGFESTDAFKRNISPTNSTLLRPMVADQSVVSIGDGEDPLMERRGRDAISYIRSNWFGRWPVFDPLKWVSP